MSTINIKRGDTFPTITDTLLLDGNPFDLTAATVTLNFKSKDTPAVISFKKVATVVGTPTDGNVSYQVEADITQDVTSWDAEWEVTKGGLIMTFPSLDFHEVNIIPDLG